jgi:bla regulator protein blaR1
MKALESLLPPNVVEAIGGTLMHAFWQLAALALALMLVLALVSRRASHTRYWLGVSTMGLMLLLPIATFVYLYEPAPAQPDVMTLVSSTSTASSANFHQPAFRPLPPITPSMTPRHGEGIMEEVSAFVQANAYLLVGLWLLGMGFFALRFAGGFWRVQRLRKQGLSPVDADLQSRFASLVARMGFRRPSSACSSPWCCCPSGC